MSYEVVCLSAVTGAAADEIAPLVAERLDFRLIDEEIVERAAREVDIDPRHVADVERRKTLISRVLDRRAPAATSVRGMGGWTPDSGLDGEALRGLIRSTIEEVAAHGRVVIVAHAASFALHERRDTLRVLLTASPQTREARLPDGGDAAKRLAESDAGRADYLKRFYGVSAERPHHYDIVVNTDRLTVSDAATRIAAMATA
jgi:cytidylate kinase